MADYEPFRPYLHTTSLRYSYGTNKGRVRRGLAGSGDRLASAGACCAALEAAGFGAVIVNRKGYEDRRDEV